MTPSAKDATRAPRTLPRPPRTIIARALYEGTAPIVGSTRLFKRETITPAAPAKAEPMKKLPYRIFSTVTPLLAAICGSTTVARAAMPIRVLMANQPTPDKRPTASITTNMRASLSEIPGRIST